MHIPEDLDVLSLAGHQMLTLQCLYCLLRVPMQTAGQGILPLQHAAHCLHSLVGNS